MSYTRLFEPASRLVLLLLGVVNISGLRTCKDVPDLPCAMAGSAGEFLRLLDSSAWESLSPGSSAVLIVSEDLDLSKEPFPEAPIRTPPEVHLIVRGAAPESYTSLVFWFLEGEDLWDGHVIYAAGNLTFEDLRIENAFIFDYTSESGDLIFPLYISCIKPSRSFVGSATMSFLRVRTHLSFETFRGGNLGPNGRILTPREYLVEDMTRTAEKLLTYSMFGMLTDQNLEMLRASCDSDSGLCQKVLWFEDRMFLPELYSTGVNLVSVDGQSDWSSITYYKDVTIIFEGVATFGPWPELPQPPNQQQSCQTVNSTTRGQDYRGDVSVSASGKTCLPWRDVLLPASGVDFTDLVAGVDGYLNGNSCRNPASHGGVWCFVEHNTTHQGVPSWEYCDVPLCKEGRQDSCAFTEDRGESYHGNVSEAFSGQPCIPWREAMLGRELFGFLEGNSCRNVGGDMLRPWCFLDETRWLYCEIPECIRPSNVILSDAPTLGPNMPLYAGAAAGAVLFISAAACGMIILFRQRRRARDLESTSEPTCETSSTKSPEIMNDAVSKNNSSIRDSSAAFSLLKGIEQNNPVVLGEVKLHKRLGAGFTSTVWSGEWLGTSCAVKILNLANMDNILSARMAEGVETTLMQTFSHPHVVRVHQVYRVAQPVDGQINESGMALSSLWIIQELCEMGDVKAVNGLQDIFGYDSDKKLLNSLTTLKHIALALQFLHSKGIVHGDLKRENVLMTQSQADGNGFAFTAKVADFGMAHCMSGRSSYYAESAVFGDMIRMAPEVIKSGKISPSMDTFSFGILIYEMLMNQSVDFNFNSPVASRVKWPQTLATNDTANLRGLQALAERCWQADPGCRPSDEELLAEIEALIRLLIGGSRAPHSIPGRVQLEGALSDPQDQEDEQLQLADMALQGLQAMDNDAVEGYRVPI